MSDELARRLVERALLEGDFVLRSGRRSSFYLDKYRFETEPELLRTLGRRIADAVAVHEPDAERLAGPALGAVALAASASMASDLPFIIVRGETKEYGTAKRIEGAFESGELVCLVEDVVTSRRSGVGPSRRGSGRPKRGLRGRPRGRRLGRARAARRASVGALSRPGAAGTA